MMEKEIQKKKKRNTDCVYFLASPLTCNKGNECEFRHSETARLNPRDCWYWMSDNCLNPTCAFRHPPLEGCTETPPVPSSKSNVPCYFYFSFICNKGDQCPFSHGNDSKQPQEKKASNETHKRLSSAEPTSNHSGSISKEFSPSTEIEEPAVKSDNNDSVLDDADFREDLASDKNSQSVKDDLESGCESSPGFDVIVGNESERFPFDRNIDCPMGRDREPEGLQRQLLPYEYGFSAGYDPFDYSTADFLQDPVMLDSYDHFDNGYNPDYPHDMFEPSKEIVLEPEWFHGRKIPPGENEIELCDPNDLRHRLLNNRRMDSNHLPHGDRSRSRRTECVVTFDGVSPEAELSVDVGTNSLSAQGGAKTHRHGRDVGYRDHTKHSSRRQDIESRKRMKHHNIRKHYPQRSEMSNDANIDEAMPIVGVVDFGRPKSFTQIKEQKRGGGESRRNPNPTKSSLEFEGPKSLSELLKQKKNQQKRENNAAECGGYRDPAENHNKSSGGGYKRKFSDDIDDDNEYSE